jgi:hypothetical protein
MVLGVKEDGKKRPNLALMTSMEMKNRAVDARSNAALSVWCAHQERPLNAPWMLLDFPDHQEDQEQHACTLK